MLLRHLLSIALLPFVVTVVVPRWLLARERTTMSQMALLVTGRIAGVLVFAAGFTMFVWCVLLFARIGRGTLAPWDPTRHLVVEGPYRHVRNPMITAVATMLGGEALFFHSWSIASWLLVFLAINHTYFVLLEEPGLVQRFGEEYERYRAAVPRWVPRLRGWPAPGRSA
ncbi:MAG TPA: isoprenylcysteine carboxylmethyltransferase family protein [Gemmatimonadaceae bacterium]|nr:isoprenylcysteine carboxylmethyltransferase family protein [Gemmatimonadaceae bacterium]